MKQKQRITKKKVEFTLPWPPSENCLHKPCFGQKMCQCKYTGKLYLKKYLTKKRTDKTTKYYDDCKIMLLAQKVPKFFNKAKMTIDYYPRRKSGWDVNNFRKAPEDALVKAGILVDDSVKYLQPGAPIIHNPVAKGELPYIKITLREL